MKKVIFKEKVNREDYNHNTHKDCEIEINMIEHDEYTVFKIIRNGSPVLSFTTAFTNSEIAVLRDFVGVIFMTEKVHVTEPICSLDAVKFEDFGRLKRILKDIIRD